MTRTHLKHYRVYVNGYDLSGYSRNVGTLAWVFDTEPDAAMTDGVKNVLLGQCDIQAGPINVMFDNDAAGAKALLAANTSTLTVTVAVGALAAPAIGDKSFTWDFEQSAYSVEQGTGFVVANLQLNTSHASQKAFAKPWGVVLAHNTARTAVNSTTGVDDYGASPPSLGGVFWYHLLTSNGTVTLTAQEADTNSDGSFGNITGATSGSITAAVTPKYGMAATTETYAVKRYLRWQLAFGTANTATFVCGFNRNTITS